MSSHPWGAIFSGVKVILFLSLRVFFLEITYFVISLLDSTIPKFIVDENEVIFTVRNSSCGKVMFLHLFSSGSRGCLSLGLWAAFASGSRGVYTPLFRHSPPQDGHCSRRYVFYWNAFLFIFWFMFI